MNKKDSLYKDMAKRESHFALRKLTVGLTSVLLGTALFLGVSSTNTFADTVNEASPQTKIENENKVELEKNNTSSNVKGSIDTLADTTNKTNSQSKVEKQNENKVESEKNSAFTVKSSTDTVNEASPQTKIENENKVELEKNNTSSTVRDSIDTLADTTNKTNLQLKINDNKGENGTKNQPNKNTLERKFVKVNDIQEEKNITKDLKVLSDKKTNYEGNGIDFSKWKYEVNSNGNVSINNYIGDKTDIVIPNNIDFAHANIINKNGKVYITTQSLNNIFDKNKTLKITFSNNGEGHIIAANDDWNGVFSNSKLTKADLRGLDTTNIKNFHAIFENDHDIKDVNASNINVSNATDMTFMFHGDNNLTNLNLTNWNPEKVKDFRSMFDGCDSLSNIDVSKWNITSATSIEAMFANNKALKSINLSNWDTSNIQHANNVFLNDNNLVSIGKAKWNFEKALEIAGIFDGCSSLKQIDSSHWGLQNCTFITNAFRNDKSLISIGDTANWNLSKVRFADGMFQSCESLEKLNTTNWGLNNAEALQFMFFHAGKLAYLDTTNWNLNKATNMQSIFDTCSNLQKINTTNWGLQNIDNICYAFVNDKKLTDIGDTTKWDLSKVTNIQHIFEGCSSLEKVNTGSWNLQNAREVQAMFQNCSSLKSLDTTNWNLNNAIHADNMFNNCYKLHQLDTTNWNMQHVETMTGMFQNDKLLTNLNLSKWNVNNVRYMGSMFAGTTNLHYLDLSKWNVNNLVNNLGTDQNNIFALSGDKLVIGNAILNDKMKVKNNLYQPWTFIMHLDPKNDLFDMQMNGTFDSLEQAKSVFNNILQVYSKKYDKNNFLKWAPSQNAIEYGNTGLYNKYVPIFKNGKSEQEKPLVPIYQPDHSIPVNPGVINDKSTEHESAYHMTTDQGWSNDLQTIIYNPVTGEYNLYFLHSVDGADNPFGTSGQNWSRQVTKDLIHFEIPQNNALEAQPDSMLGPDGKKVDLKDNINAWKSAWTGSIVQNTYGIVKDVPKDAYISYFSGLKKSDNSQNIWAVYSLDGGKTFDHVLNNGNPVIDYVKGSKDANNERDAGVFYYNGHGKTEMYMACAENDKLGIYVSDDGINWVKSDPDPNKPAKVGGESVLTGFNNSDTPLECPAVRFMYVTDGNGNIEKDAHGNAIVKAVIFFGGKRNQYGETTGTYYRVGHLDKNGLFVPEYESHRVDEGSDYYGANFSGSADINKPDKSIISMGWIGNWSYTSSGIKVNGANNVSARLGSYSLPRTLVLHQNGIIKSIPIVKGLEKVTDSNVKQTIKKDGPSVILKNQPVNSYYDMVFSTANQQPYQGKIIINIAQGKDYVNISFDPISGIYKVTGNSEELSGNADDYYKYGLSSEGGYLVNSGIKGQSNIKLQIFTDKNSIEIFFPNGQTYTITRFGDYTTQSIQIDGQNDQGNNQIELNYSEIENTKVDFSKLKNNVIHANQIKDTVKYKNSSLSSKEELNNTLEKAILITEQSFPSQKEIDIISNEIQLALSKLDGKEDNNSSNSNNEQINNSSVPSVEQENNSSDSDIKQENNLLNPDNKQVIKNNNLNNETNDTNKINTPKNKEIVIHSFADKNRINVFNIFGKRLKKTVRVGSIYSVKGIKKIKGVLYYKVIIKGHEYYLPVSNTRSINRFVKESKFHHVVKIRIKTKTVNLLDWDGHRINRKIKNNATYVTWAKKRINHQLCYRIGNENEWIPAKYTKVIK